MGSLKLWLAILIVFVFVGHSRAQGTISWTSGYPATSAFITGGIDVKGSITVDSGWTRANSVTVRAWRDGTEETTVIHLFCGNSFTCFIVPGNSGSTYNVVVELVLTDSCSNTVTIRTAVGSAKTK